MFVIQPSFNKVGFSVEEAQTMQKLENIHGVLSAKFLCLHVANLASSKIFHAYAIPLAILISLIDSGWSQIHLVCLTLHLSKAIVSITPDNRMRHLQHLL